MASSIVPPLRKQVSGGRTTWWVGAVCFSRKDDARKFRASLIAEADTARSTRLSFETEQNETRAAVARNKPCEGCGRSWDECGGGYIGFAEGAELEAKWKCEACMPPVFACGRPNCHCRAQVHLSEEEMLEYMTTASLAGVPSRASIVVDKLTELFAELSDRVRGGGDR